MLNYSEHLSLGGFDDLMLSSLLFNLSVFERIYVNNSRIIFLQGFDINTIKKLLQFLGIRNIFSTITIIYLTVISIRVK